MINSHLLAIEELKPPEHKKKTKIHLFSINFRIFMLIKSRKSLLSAMDLLVGKGSKPLKFDRKFADFFQS